MPDHLEKVDKGSAVDLFDGKIVKEQIKRLEEKMDILIVLHAASLFPIMEDPKKDGIGDLRLLST